MIEGQMARQAIAASDVLRVVMHRIALLVCWSFLRVVECVSVDGALVLDSARNVSSCVFLLYVWDDIDYDKSFNRSVICAAE